MLIKICGITRLEDAEAAVEHGAGAIGFVFWPESPRFIDPFRARRIAVALPAFVTTVGVFVNQSERYVNEVIAVAGLGAVQLHGDESPAFAARINRPVLKVVARPGAWTAEDWPARIVLLVDTHDSVKRGGTGRTGDWAGAAALARRRRVVLAGGLHSGNVAEAVAAVRPFGVDVSSGVEASPGIKDHARMTAFFEALR